MARTYEFNWNDIDNPFSMAEQCRTADKAFVRACETHGSSSIEATRADEIAMGRTEEFVKTFGSHHRNFRD